MLTSTAVVSLKKIVGGSARTPLTSLGMICARVDAGQHAVEADDALLVGDGLLDLVDDLADLLLRDLREVGLGDLQERELDQAVGHRHLGGRSPPSRCPAWAWRRPWVAMTRRRRPSCASDPPTRTPAAGTRRRAPRWRWCRHEATRDRPVPEPLVSQPWRCGLGRGRHFGQRHGRFGRGGRLGNGRGRGRLGLGRSRRRRCLGLEQRRDWRDQHGCDGEQCYSPARSVGACAPHDVVPFLFLVRPAGCLWRDCMPIRRRMSAVSVLMVIVAAIAHSASRHGVRTRTRDQP